MITFTTITRAICKRLSKYIACLALAFLMPAAIFGCRHQARDTAPETASSSNPARGSFQDNHNSFYEDMEDNTFLQTHHIPAQNGVQAMTVEIRGDVKRGEGSFSKYIVTSISITDEGGALVQTIVPDDIGELIENGLQFFEAEYSNWNITIQDCNFDGYLDMALLEYASQRSDIRAFFLWDHEKGIFTYDTDLNALPLIDAYFDAEKKLIFSHDNDNGINYCDRYYQYKNGRPVLVKLFSVALDVFTEVYHIKTHEWIDPEIYEAEHAKKSTDLEIPTGLYSTQSGYHDGRNSFHEDTQKNTFLQTHHIPAQNGVRAMTLEVRGDVERIEDYSTWYYVSSISITDENGAFVQTIVPDDIGELIEWRLRFLGAEYSHMNITIQDCNFDGYLDMALSKYGSTIDNIYAYFLWDHEKGRFTYDTDLNALPLVDPHFDAEKKLIFTRNSKNGITYRDRYYQYKDGRPVLTKFFSVTFDDFAEAYHIKTHEWIDSEIYETGHGEDE